MSKYIVAIENDIPGYPGLNSGPEVRYPEYPGKADGGINPVYASVRKLLFSLGLDRDNFGKPRWNPFGGLISPGNTVFIKPNLETHEYGRKTSKKEGELFSLITHPSVVRAVVDYAAIALKGKGRIIIGDNPAIDTDFSKLLEATRLESIADTVSRVFEVECSVLDLRPLWCEDPDDYGIESRMQELPGDPDGEKTVNLGKESFLYGIDPVHFRGAFTDRTGTIAAHRGETQEYAFSRSIYNADVFISIPKLKTHHKSGTALNIYGLFGACSKKNRLVRWKTGYPEIGGDEYPDNITQAEKTRVKAAIALEKVLPGKAKMMSLTGRFRGAWEGNDTAWRTAADLYLCMLKRDRKYFSVIDGVLAGEKEGPFLNDTKCVGVLMASSNLLAADYAGTRLMGFDVSKVKYLKALMERLNVREEDIELRPSITENLGFLPPDFWPGLVNG